MPDDLRAAAHEALILNPSPQMRYQRRGRFALRDGIALLAWDWPDPTNRTASAVGPAAARLTLETVLATGAAFFGPEPASWSVQLEAGATPQLEHDLEQRGWRVAEEEPALVLPAAGAVPAPPAGLQILRVATQSDLETHWQVADAAFAEIDAPAPAPAGSTTISQSFMPSLASALDPDIALLLGLVNGQPVATSAVCRVGASAVVMGVSTLPAYRRRGIGAAMTWAAIGQGVARGCTRAVLRATEAGYPVYRAMGFLPACRYRSYVTASG